MNMRHLYLKSFYHKIDNNTIKNEVFSHWLGIFLKFYKWKCMGTKTWKGYKKQAGFY